MEDPGQMDGAQDDVHEVVPRRHEDHLQAAIGEQGLDPTHHLVVPGEEVAVGADLEAAHHQE